MSRWHTPKTDRELQELTEVWQKRLRLKDWIIKARFGTSKEDKKKLEPDGAFAYTYPSPGFKEALIVLKAPADLKTTVLGCRDIEVTLVHELLHLHAEMFDHFFMKPSTKRPVEFAGLEAMIELVAQALVEAVRGVPREKWDKG